eukprot:6166842-Amphidinium_carterae.1
MVTSSGSTPSIPDAIPLARAAAATVLLLKLSTKSCGLPESKLSVTCPSTVSAVAGGVEVLVDAVLALASNCVADVLLEEAVGGVAGVLLEAVCGASDDDVLLEA